MPSTAANGVCMRKLRRTNRKEKVTESLDIGKVLKNG